MTNFLRKLFLIDILKGLWVTFKYTVRPKVTYEYPEKPKPPREAFRGLLRLHKNEQGEPLCIGCKMCQRACPESLFVIEAAKGADNKMRPTRFDWNLSRCTFCGLCVEACPTSAIRFSHEFRLAALDRGRFLFTMEEMYAETDVQRHLKPEEEKQ